MKLPARHSSFRTARLRRTASDLTRRQAVAGLLGTGLGAVLPTGAADAKTTAQEKTPGAPLWKPDHTVIVILENLSAYDATAAQRKTGDAPVYSPQSDWRFLNQLAKQGMRFTNAHFARTPYGSALPTRSSQPNYLFLFSAHHQGVLPPWFEDLKSPYQGDALCDRDGRPLPERRQTKVGVANNNVPLEWLPLTSPNLGAALLKSGGTFLSFCESLPYPSWNCGTDSRQVPCSASHAPTDFYRRKHNPTINWTDQLAPTSERGLKGDLPHNVLPISVNLGFEATRDPVLKQSFRGFAQDASGKSLPFSQLPTVSIVVPNEQNDAHSNSAKVADDWLQTHIGPYADWAMRHNSLLIITFDEDGSTDASQGNPYITGTHRIPTIFVGAGVKQGESSQRIDHLSVLSTVLWLNGALDTFKADFKQFHGVTAGAGSEAEKEWLALEPITDVFHRPVVKQK
ncbi:MAG: alkaline phosphatase family protein [Aquabacterium sp.]|uniref:alkaline phosphatase family protein n=1 Tax=Aquabacterium sp. TaxID=1872578 RepID=UPI003BD8695B